MQLSKEAIEEYKKIFKEEYSKELPYEEVYEAAHNLVGFFDLLLKIDMRANPQRYEPKKEDLFKSIKK